MILALLLAMQNPVVLSRVEAERMTAAELERRLLGGFAHARIRSAKVAPETAVRLEPVPQALAYVVFMEEGRPLRGRLCSARRLVAQFDTLDGKLASDNYKPGAREAPRRLHDISPAPLIAVLDRPASASACAAATRFGQLPSRGTDAAVDALERFAAAAEIGRAAVECTDEIAGKFSPCDGRAVLASLDWRDLLTIETGLPYVTDGGIRLIFAGKDYMTLQAPGGESIERIVIRRGPPPPF